MKINKSTKQFILNNADHNTHLENPDMYINTLLEIIDNQYT